MQKDKKIFRPEFWHIPTIISDNPKIEPFDEKVYAAIHWFQKMKDGECRASNQTIAKLVKPSDPQPRSVQNSLTRLEECGFILREYKDEAKRNRVRINALISYKVERIADDSHKSNETVMIDERILDDRHERIGDDQSKNSISKNISKNIIVAQDATGAEIQKLIDLFKDVNPSYARLYPNTTQRSALKRMVKIHSIEKVEKIIKSLPASNLAQYAPTITTPIDLENKLGALVAYWQKQKGRGSMLIRI